MDCTFCNKEILPSAINPAVDLDGLTVHLSCAEKWNHEANGTGVTYEELQEAYSYSPIPIQAILQS